MKMITYDEAMARVEAESELADRASYEHRTEDAAAHLVAFEEATRVASLVMEARLGYAESAAMLARLGYEVAPRHMQDGGS